MKLNYLSKDFKPEDVSFDSIEEEMAFCLELGSCFSLMPEGEGVAPSWLLKSKVEDEVVFYPGTFNPWHLGHRACLDLCPGKPIIIVPDFNPWKEGEKRQRPWELVKDLLFRLENTNYSIFPGFLGKETGNPTIDWFPKVNIRNKSLLIGDDSFLSLHKWKDSAELVKHISTLYVAPRGARGDLLEEQIKKFPGLNIVFLEHHDFEGVSSTGLRKE
ncbi:MAG: hypothetical protein CME70_01705 [Halobacteriovorax sp.]|nr:hypothetical protein [Halobacteriovorax sp.]|tara:strand:+ start:4990 stop:5637 length:648 start_codon:yes stop_codon:yes gene_type:complete